MSIVLVAFAAAHEGEEFVIALPIVMLVAAFFLMRWSQKGGQDDDIDLEQHEPEPAPPTFEPVGRR